MGFELALFYGFIQGISEFLPVSSSGHLALIPFFMSLRDPGVVFDLLMHLGTAFAVIIYFWNELKELFSQMISYLLRDSKRDTSFFKNFTLSTIATLVLIVLFKKFAFDFGRQPLVIGINFIFFGILMYLADRREGNDIDLTKTTKTNNALLIGLAQGLAIFPGVSRSGITLTVARSLKINRLQASRYSFLLSLPIIIGSIIFKLPEIIDGSATSVEPMIMLAGVVFSFIFGIFTIHFFLKLIAKIGLVYFSIYRVLLGALLVYLSFSS